MRFVIGVLALFVYHLVPALASLNLTQAASIVEIGQTINLFGALVDSGKYDQLDRVFTTNTSVDFGLPGVGTLHGLPAVRNIIAVISNVTSQHSLTTYHADLQSPTTANATSYIIGSFFGQGPQAGQIFTVYGTYYISMLMTSAGWRVNTLTLTQTGSVGNISIAFPNGVP